jgi:predicted GNAT family N-acyltransferase
MHIRISLPQQTLELHDELGDAAAPLPRVNGHERSRGAATAAIARRADGISCAPKIGAGATPNTVFRGRRPTGEIWTPQLAGAFPGRDWILTRILWLSGKEPGRNRLGEASTPCAATSICMGRPIRPPWAPPDRSAACACATRHHRIVRPGAGATPGRYRRVRPRAGSWDAWRRPARLRESVFVEEQKVPRELEMDGHDALSRHVLARDAPTERPIGTGRLLPDGHIGRMAVAGRLARQGRGPRLARTAAGRGGAAAVRNLALNAQTTAAASIGDSASSRKARNSSKPGLPHQAMRVRSA